LLFDRKSTRKPQLTEAGRGVLSEARTITNGINGLRDKVRNLRQDIEAEISLVLDVMLPASAWATPLKAFRASCIRAGRALLQSRTLPSTSLRKLPNVALMFTTGIAAPAQAGVQGHRLCACPPCSCQSLPLAKAGGQALGARFCGHDEI
jgi:DNA-binding transcriptional LysR family regulator